MLKQKRIVSRKQQKYNRNVLILGTFPREAVLEHSRNAHKDSCAHPCRVPALCACIPTAFKHFWTAKWNTFGLPSGIQQEKKLTRAQSSELRAHEYYTELRALQSSPESLQQSRSPPERKGNERKGKERKGKERKGNESTQSSPEAMEMHAEKYWNTVKMYAKKY